MRLQMADGLELWAAPFLVQSKAFAEINRLSEVRTQRDAHDADSMLGLLIGGSLDVMRRSP